MTEPNEEITAARGETTILQDGGHHTGLGDLICRWRPHNGLLLDVPGHGGGMVDLGDQEFRMDPLGLGGSVHIHRSGGRHQGYVNSIGTDHEAPVHGLRFHLGNFWDSGRVRPDPDGLGFAYEEAQVHISRGDGFFDGCNPRAPDEQFILTHFGEVTTHDDEPLSQNRVERLLPMLADLFSFTLGAYAGPVLCAGLNYNNGAGNGRDPLVWLDYSLAGLEPLGTKYNWASERLEEATAAIAQGFLAKREEVGEPLRDVIHYYLEAIKTIHVPSAIILAQAALELMSSIILEDTVISSEGFDTLKAADKIRASLRFTQADTEPPPILDDGAELQEWIDAKVLNGPETVTQIRNRLIHMRGEPENSPPIYNIDALLRVRQVALEYLELLVLWEAGYEGIFFSRGADDHQVVPWL